MGSVTVDLSALETLKEALGDMDNQSLQVGWFDSAKYNDNTPVAAVAAGQELGTKTAPSRPFFRPAIAENETAWSSLVEDGALAAINGTATGDQVMSALGMTVVGDVKDKIAGPHLALSPITLALRKLRNDNVPIGGKMVGMVAAAIKAGETGPGELGEPFGNTTPLNETGLMLATLTYELGE